MHYLLCYDLAPDYLERRAEFRTEHLQLAWQAQQRGELVLAGALSDPADMALLMFQGDSPAAAEAFARADPYVDRRPGASRTRCASGTPWWATLAFTPVDPPDVASVLRPVVCITLAIDSHDGRRLSEAADASRHRPMPGGESAQSGRRQHRPDARHADRARSAAEPLQHLADPCRR